MKKVGCQGVAPLGLVRSPERKDHRDCIGPEGERRERSRCAEEPWRSRSHGRIKARRSLFKRRADFRALSFQSEYAMMKRNYCKKGNKTMPATRLSMWHLVVSRKNG